MPRRDAVAISMLYGLGLRPQELFGATFRQQSRERFRVAQVLTQAAGPSGKPIGRVIAAAKTVEGVRTMAMGSWLYEELHDWRALLVEVGLPAGEDDFIVPGAAERNPELAFLLKATPYSLRRGHISLRVLAGEDIKRIADDGGTSTAMIHRHYLHELDLRHEMPADFSFDGAVRVARRAVRGWAAA